MADIKGLNELVKRVRYDLNALEQTIRALQDRVYALEGFQPSLKPITSSALDTAPASVTLSGKSEKRRANFGSVTGVGGS